MNPRSFSTLSSDVRPRAAFTLVEVLVSMTILIILLLISAQVIATVQNTWTTSNARVSQFREARTAFDIITRNLSQATLNSYVDYDNSYLKAAPGAAGVAAPNQYVRKSDLRFRCGETATLLPQRGAPEDLPGHAVFFQAPLGVSHDPAYVGLDRLLCGRGYFVQYTSDEFFRPSVLPAGQPNYRYRLMEFSPPAEKNLIYGQAGEDPDQWYTLAGVPRTGDETPVDHGLTRPIADNIIALVIAPQFEMANAAAGADQFQSMFAYDSKPANPNNPGPQDNRLPSLVRVILVAVDERTADRLTQGSSPQSPPLGNDITNLFGGAGAADDLNATMELVSTELRAKNLNFRIFSATVTLRGAKWSN